jgi:hypothetical protein
MPALVRMIATRSPGSICWFTNFFHNERTGAMLSREGQVVNNQRHGAPHLVIFQARGGNGRRGGDCDQRDLPGRQGR